MAPEWLQSVSMVQWKTWEFWRIPLSLQDAKGTDMKTKVATSFNRRKLLSSAVVAGSGLALAPHARALDANDDIRIAVVGFRGQGGLHLKNLRELEGVRVVAVCDVDPPSLLRCDRPTSVAGTSRGVC